MKKSHKFLLNTLYIAVSLFSLYFTLGAAFIAENSFEKDSEIRAFLVILFLVILPEILLLVLDGFLNKKYYKKSYSVHVIEMIPAIFYIFVWLFFTWPEIYKGMEYGVPWLLIFISNVFCICLKICREKSLKQEK